MTMRLAPWRRVDAQVAAKARVGRGGRSVAGSSWWLATSGPARPQKPHGGQGRPDHRGQAAALPGGGRIREGERGQGGSWIIGFKTRPVAPWPAQVIPSALAPTPTCHAASPSPRRPPPRTPLRQPLCGCAARSLAPGVLHCAGLVRAAAGRAGAGRRPSAWDEPLTLRKSPALQETIPESVRTQLPVFVTGDRISGQTDLNATIEGNAELRRGDTVIRADRLDYNVPEDLAKAARQRAHQPRRQQLRRPRPWICGCGCV